jgi:hypothetical protein
MKNLRQFLIMSVAIALSNNAVAAGLADATSEVSSIQIWLYGITGVFSLLFMTYQIVLSLLEKQPWSDVVMAFGKVAAAGGSVVGATWAWGIWGS